MKKTLLLLFTLVASLTSAMAQTYFWQEDFSSYVKGDVPTGGDYNYVCVNGAKTTCIYEEKLAGGTSPELLVQKTGGSFSATIPLKGASGEFTLSFQSNRKTLAVAVTNATLGTVTASGNNYTYPITVAAGTESITITFSEGKDNARLDDIKLFQGEGKKAAGLSWGTASRSVTIGSESNNFPTLTNDNNLDVTYSSSDEAVATIDAQGNITLVAQGTTNISAAFAGNDNYEAQTVTYTLTVSGGSPSDGGDTGVDISNTPETAYTVAKANELIAAGCDENTKVYVKGTIVSVYQISTSYGNATYYISDDGTTTGQLTVYRGYGLNGNKFTSEDEIRDGDEVIVYGKLTNYNGTYEIATGSQIYSLNGKRGDTSVDISNTPETAYTIAKSYELIDANQGLNTEVYVKGIIVSISDVNTQYGNATYNIADDAAATDQLTVFRGKYLENEKFEKADQIKVGDEVIVYGKLTNYNGSKQINSGNYLYSLNGAITGISKVNIEGAKAEGTIYSIDGRRLNKLVKGVNIVNGKKIVVK